MTHKPLKNELHLLRQTARATQAKFAESMGVSLRSYEELESGRTPTRPLHLNAAKWALQTLRDEATMGKAMSNGG